MRTGLAIRRPDRSHANGRAQVARTAVRTVLGFLKDKLPAPIAGQIENVIGGGESAGGVGDIAAKVGGFLS